MLSRQVHKAVYDNTWRALGFISSLFDDIDGFNSLSTNDKEIYRRLDLTKKSGIDRHFPFHVSGSGKLFPPISIRGFSTNISLVFRKIREFRRLSRDQ